MHWARKIIALLQTGLQVWTPAFLLYWAASRPLPVYAGRFLDAARQGQAFGRVIVPYAPNLAGQDSQGNLILNWKDQTSSIEPEALFPDTQNTEDPDLAELYGNDAGIISRAQSELEKMQESGSYSGQTYRGLYEAVNRARVSMSNDPIWKQTDDIVKQLQKNEFSDCEIIVGKNRKSKKKHVPDYRTCERIVHPGDTCHFQHDYTIEYLRQFGVTASCWTDDDCVIKVDLRTNTILACYGSHTAYGCTVSSPPVNYEEVCADVNEGIIRSVAATQSTYQYGVYQLPSCDNDMVAILYVHNTAGSHQLQHLTVSVAVNQYHIVDRGWTSDKGCEILLRDIDGDEYVKPAGNPPTYGYYCSRGPCDTATQIAGAWVSENDLYSTNPFKTVGISNLAHEVTVPIDNNFNKGKLGCWTDPQGVEHCPDNLGNRKDTCEELENDPNCSYVKQECIKGAQDPQSGICYAWTVIFDCGGDDETTVRYNCNGVIRCMGEECIEGQYDPNNKDFAKAAAMLQVAQYAMSDVDCSDPHAGCRIWTGKDYECKKALGGWVDCCTQPQGISFVDYIRLLTASHKMTAINWSLEKFLPNPFGGNPFHGTWADLSQYTDFIEKALSSAWDSLVGTSEKAVTATIGERLTQAIMRKAYEFVNAISPDMARMIFNATQITPIGGGQSITYVTLTPAMQTIVSMVNFIMWLYTIYQILDLLVQIIWQCEEDEFVLGAKRRMKVCHYIGSYCKTSIGVCVEKRDSYCCFNSPLARIMQEQIRGQLGISWGEPDDPDCHGLLISELENVDWEKIDLSEWLALLNLSGKYPTQKTMSIEGLTGPGSSLDFGTTSEPRQDARTRIVERLEQAGNLEEKRIEWWLNKWGQGGD